MLRHRSLWHIVSGHVAHTGVRPQAWLLQLPHDAFFVASGFPPPSTSVPNVYHIRDKHTWSMTPPMMRLDAKTPCVEQVTTRPGCRPLPVALLPVKACVPLVEKHRTIQRDSAFCSTPKNGHLQGLTKPADCYWSFNVISTSGDCRCTISLGGGRECGQVLDTL